MAVISLLNGDWEWLLPDETVGTNAVAGLNVIREASGSSGAIYTTNALYSAIADVADAFQAMGFKNPMLPVTPNAYTMENQAFIPRSSTEKLKEGAIDADWSVSAGEGVYRKVYTTVTAAPVAGDIGRQVTEATSGDTGTLLDFEVEPDGTTVLWIRPDTAGDTFALSTALTCTGDGGACNVLGSGAATSGQTLYPSIQAIGSVPTAAEVYLYQNRYKMTDSAGAFQWWATDPTVNLGIIDILVRVINAGVSIADGDVEVFARRYTSLYDNFRLNVAAGGRSALPLASAPDINNTTGYARVTSDAWDAGWTPVAGDVFQEQGNASQKGVVTAISGTGPNFTIDFYHTGDLGTFLDNDVIEDVSQTGDITLSSNETATPDGPTETGSGNGATVTLTLGTTTRDHDGDATAEPYSIIVDAQSLVPIATVYEVIKYRTRRGADEAALFGAGFNIPGESYRGLDLQAQYITPSGVFTEGDDITGPGGYTARVVSVNTTGTYVMLTDQQTSLDSIGDTDVLTDESSDTVTVSGTPVSIVSPKASPLGTFTGTQIFGARGVDFRNPAPADVKAYILTDDNGVLRNPPNTVSYSVVNTAAGDRILVARDTGTAGVIDKDQFGGLAAPAGAYNGLADGVVRVAGTLDTEVAQTGFVRIVETTLQQEHRYVYASRTVGASGEFTLRNCVEGTGITTAGAPTGGLATITDTTADFTNATNPVEVGMLVRNTTGGKVTHVWEVVGSITGTTMQVRQLYGPLDATQDWDIADTYTINTLIQDYAATDDLFDLIVDEEATGTSVSNTFIKTLASDFGTVVNVRQGKVILPFTQNQTQGDGNTTVTTVRQPDTIAA